MNDSQKKIVKEVVHDFFSRIYWGVSSHEMEAEDWEYLKNKYKDFLDKEY